LIERPANPSTAFQAGEWTAFTAGLAGLGKAALDLAKVAEKFAKKTLATRVADEVAGASKKVDEAALAAVDRGSRRPNAETRRQADDAARDADGNLRCAHCGDKLTEEAGYPNSREYDHVDPWSKGGDSSIDNIVDSCRSCNRSRGSKALDEWEGRN